MPDRVPVHEGLFADDHLIGGRCGRCRRYVFPRARSCPYCGADDVEPVALSPTGVLWGWTTVTAAPPGYQGDVPVGFGVVELPEGVRVITRLTESDVDALESGMPMRTTIVPLRTDDDGNTVVTYAFAPDGPS